MTKHDAKRLQSVFMDQLARRFADDLMEAIDDFARRYEYIRFMVGCDQSDEATLSATVMLLVNKYEGDHVDFFDEVRFFYGTPRFDVMRRLEIAVEEMNEKLEEHEISVTEGGAA